MRKIALGTAALLAAAVLYLGFWPVPINPAAWTPPEAPEPRENSRLRGARRLATDVVGPEATVVGPDGKLYAGARDGRVMRIDLASGKAEPFAATGGRPLGMKFDAAGALIVADPLKGSCSSTRAARSRSS